MKLDITSGRRTITLDTEDSELLGQHDFGTWGDPAGYSEKLYKSPSRRYFVHCEGGPSSPYPTETIKPILKKDTIDW